MELDFNYREAGITFKMQLPEKELGMSAYRKYEYTIRRPWLWAVLLVSSWGEQKKLLGFRLNIERDLHIAPVSSHWCEDCIAPCGFCSTRSV